MVRSTCFVVVLLFVAPAAVWAQERTLPRCPPEQFDPVRCAPPAIGPAPVVVPEPEPEPLVSRRLPMVGLRIAFGFQWPNENQDAFSVDMTANYRCVFEFERTERFFLTLSGEFGTYARGYGKRDDPDLFLYNGVAIGAGFPWLAFFAVTGVAIGNFMSDFAVRVRVGGRIETLMGMFGVELFDEIGLMSQPERHSLVFLGFIDLGILLYGVVERMRGRGITR